MALCQSTIVGSSCIESAGLNIGEDTFSRHFRNNGGGSGKYDPGMCPSELTMGCIVNFSVEAVVPGGATAFPWPVQPNRPVIPITFVGYLSSPFIRIEQIRNSKGKPAGLLGTGITTSLNPQYFTWEMLRSGFNGYPVDAGIADRNNDYALFFSNSDTNEHVFDALFFAVIPGIAGINYLFSLGRITAAARDRMCEMVEASKPVFKDSTFAAEE